jgi:RNA polymerase sigma-B factor
VPVQLDDPIPSWLPEPHAAGNREYERWVLHARYARTADPEDLQRLVDQYRAYTSSLARRYVRNGEPLEDLLQVACEALVVALQRYDPHRGVRFLAFATPTIAGALKRHYRDLGWSIRVPRRVHEIVGPARDAADELTAQLGRKPTVAEVATAIGVDEETLLLANDAAATRNPRSLDVPEDDRGGGRAPGSTDTGFERTEERMVLVEAFSSLPEADRDLVELYYFRGLSQSAIAARTGVSQMQVSRLLTRAVGRLRTTMVA